MGSVLVITPPYINYVCKNENKRYLGEESKTCPRDSEVPQGAIVNIENGEIN